MLKTSGIQERSQFTRGQGFIVLGGDPKGGEGTVFDSAFRDRDLHERDRQCQLQ
jgi:hypothetical protein